MHEHEHHWKKYIFEEVPHFAQAERQSGTAVWAKWDTPFTFSGLPVETCVVVIDKEIGFAAFLFVTIDSIVTYFILNSRGFYMYFRSFFYEELYDLSPKLIPAWYEHWIISLFTDRAYASVSMIAATW